MNGKILLLSFAVSMIFKSGFADVTDNPVIMTIDGQDFKKSEFEYIYNKNIQQQIEKKSLDEYVEMFRDYKLKVIEAEACGIDTTEAFIKEFNEYRNQLAAPYLKDAAVEDSLVNEAYDRLKTDVEVAHILLVIDNKMPDKSEDAVYEKAKRIVDEIRSGKSFEELAAKYSEDQSTAKNNGYIGFIRGFMTVFPFEDAAYNTATGEVSDPVLSQFGYHIVKVISRRPNPGEIRTAHIILKVPSNATEAVKQSKRDTIYSIYERLKNGAEFAAMAEKYSEDQESRQRGGIMPWLSAGRIIKEYEDAAFALKEPGDISEPFLSPYGWHIVKLLDKRGVKPLDELRKNILRRISRDERADIAQKTLIERLKDEYGFSADGSKMEKIEMLAASFRPDDPRFIEQIAGSNDVIFSIAEKSYTASDFANYLSKHRKSAATDNVEMLMERMEAFIDHAILSYEDSRLEEKYPEFRNLINEYHDGILLFDISNRMVWSEASKDVKGLEKYFKKHKRNYAWESPKFKGYAVECINDSIAGLVSKSMKALANDDSLVYKLYNEFNSKNLKQVSIKKGLFAYGENDIIDYCIFESDKKPVNESLPVVFAKGKLLKKGPECYTDVRGRVISDYQGVLEKEWVKELNKKHDVVIYDDVVATIKEQE